MLDFVEYFILNGVSVNKIDRFNYIFFFIVLIYRVSLIIIKILILYGSNLEGAKVFIMV